MPIAVRVLIAMVFACGFAAPLRAEEKPASAFDPSVARRIKPEEVQQRQKAGQKAIILDTRASMSDEIVKGAVLVPADGIEAWAKNVPKKTLIVAYCT
jgi:hypothetical protein